MQRSWYAESDYLEREERLAALPGRRALLERLLAAGRRGLDLGCLGGALGSLLVERGAWVVGVDFLAPALRRASARGLRPVLADLERPLPFAPASFDFAWAGEVLEHLFDPLVLLREAARVLRPGGLLGGSVPNAVALRERWRLLRGREPLSVGGWADGPAGDHLRALGPARLEELARRAGFRPLLLLGLAAPGSRWGALVARLRPSWADFLGFVWERPR